MTNCLFCKIVSGELPCHKIYENENILAFLDINPLNMGHALIIPKEHYETIFDMNEGLSGEIMKAGWKVANVVKEVLVPDGMNLLQSNYKAANQIVPHFHLHIIPRFEEDGLRMADWKLVPAENEQLTKIADQLREML